MKIAIVTETFLPNTDGIVTRLCASIRWLLHEGHEVLVVSPELGIKEFEGAKVAGIPSRSFFLYRDKKFAYPNRKVGREISEFNPDIVHVVNPAFLGVAGIYYARKFKLPLLASYHTHIPNQAEYYHVPFLKPVLWGYLRMLHNRADLNLCTSQSVLTDLKQQRFHNVHLWQRGVDTESFHPGHGSEEIRNRLTNGSPDKLLLLFVGRLAAEKKIEQIREVLENTPNTCLALVGDGPHRKYLEKYFSGTDTVFTGFMHGEELSRVYASSDAFVFPSTSETLGLVILESMASGLPIVAANNGPTAEQIVDGENGVLYDPEISGDIARAVERIKDPFFRKKISMKARKQTANMDWDKQSEQLLGFYQQVLKLNDRDWLYQLENEGDV